jgi:O-antigen ligase
VSRSVSPDRWGAGLRALLIALVVAAPLAFGAVHPTSILLLLVLSAGAGLVSWARGHGARGRGEPVPKLPGRRLLLAFQALVLVQLVPLPLGLLGWISPGSLAHYRERSLVPLEGFHPISVSPGDTLRGLAFIVGFSLLYAAAFREIDDNRRRRRLAAAVVVTGLAMTIVGLVQSAYGATSIYGLWQPVTWWAIFGPYANRNHFAGYLVMAIALALGSVQGGFHDLRRAWERRRLGWLALGETEGSTFVRRAAAAMALVVGLLVCASRGGFVAFTVSTLALLLASRRASRGVIALSMVVVLVAGVGIAWVGLGGILQGFESRGIQESRIELWKDAARLIPGFPLFGVGFNAFGSAYAWHQTFWRWYWIGQAHNEYLQVLLDTGIVGALLFLGILAVLFRAAARGTARGPLEVGYFAALVALAVHNLVEYNWQIPANAATYVVLAGAAVRAGEGAPAPRRA